MILTSTLLIPMKKIAILNEKIEEVEKLYSEVRDAADEMNIWSYDTTVKKYRI